MHGQRGRAGVIPRASLLATATAPAAVPDAPPELSFPDLAEEFLACLDAAPATLRTYRGALSRFGRWAAEQEPADLGDLARRFKRARMEGGSSPATVALELAALRSLGGFLVRTGRLARNLPGDVRPPRLPSYYRRDALTRDQAAALLAAVPSASLPGLRTRAILSLMLRAGLRDVEIHRADVGDLGTRQGRAVLWVHGKGRAAADSLVVLNDQAAAAVRAYLEIRGATPGEAPLFAVLTRGGRGRLSVRQVQAVVTEALRAAGLKTPRITAHSLRHTAATLAIDAGVPLPKVQAMLRHADPRTTMRYVHQHERVTQAAELALDF